MAATVTIYRHAETIDFDDITGLADLPGPRTEVYSGKARIWTSNTGSVTVVGEAEITLTMTNVSIPLDASLPQKDDVIVVDANAHDTATVGNTYRVMGVDGGGLIGGARRMSCSTFSDSAFWEDL